MKLLKKRLKSVKMLRFKADITILMKRSYQVFQKSCDQCQKQTTIAYHHTFLENARIRGTKHEAIEAFEMIGIEPDEEEIKLYFDNYKRVKAKHKFEVVKSEIMLTNGNNTRPSNYNQWSVSNQ